MPTLPPEFWQEERKQLLGVILPKVEASALAGAALATQRLASAQIYFDTGLVNAAAAAWARQHTDALLNMLGTTNQKVVGTILDNWWSTPGATYGDLIERLTPILDGNISRAESVASTEVTRSNFGGQLAAFLEAGAVAPPTISDPRLGVITFGPPSHPRCRCDSIFTRKGDKYLIAWITTHDELTCTRPITTPWGTVNGCRALNGVCISQGEWMGRKVL